MSIDRSQFSEEVSENRVATREPLCMTQKKNEQLLSFGAPCLNDEEAKPAKASLLNDSYLKMDFPKKLRMRVDPPLSHQNFFLFTFMPSKGAAPDTDGCFGVMKFRGSFPTDRDADEYGEMLIRTVDSINENLIGRVGHDFPVSLDSKYCAQTKEVDVRAKLDELARNKVRSQREQEKKEMEEIEDRQKQLLSDTSEAKEQSFDDLEYYTQLRVKRANIRILQEECQKKMKECSKILSKTSSEIHALDDKHPQFCKQYEERYKSAVSAIGGETKGNKLIEAMR